MLHYVRWQLHFIHPQSHSALAHHQSLLSQLRYLLEGGLADDEEMEVRIRKLFYKWLLIIHTANFSTLLDVRPTVFLDYKTRLHTHHYNFT